MLEKKDGSYYKTSCTYCYERKNIWSKALNFMLLIHWFELQMLLLMYVYLNHSPSATQITLVLLLHEE